jgi:DNA-binding SARP family transcriptional activator/DNA-binding XRE family transcriptional regulator
MDVQPDAAGARSGALIRKYRRAAGLTQQQLADRSGLSVATVRDLEQGRSRRPRATSLAAIASALRLNPAESDALVAAGAGAPASHGSGLWLAVLGPVAAWRDGLPLRLGPSRQVTVLGLLAVQPGQFVRRATVIDALWGPRPPVTAAALVQAHVAMLRRILDPAGRDRLIEQGAAGYRLRAGKGELDVAAFEELARQAQAAAAGGDAVAACGLYDRALELWRGEPAADAEVLWDHPAVTGLTNRRTEVLLQYAEAARGLGLYARVITLLERQAREQPLDERVRAELIMALAGTGRQDAAIKMYAHVRGELKELGMDPGPGLAKAYEHVLRQDIPSAPSESTTAAHGRGNGVGPHSVPEVKYSLPPDTLAFTGRREELDNITAAVMSAAAVGGVMAIHAISGMPGVGKTALAVHAAYELKSRFPDRQLFLDLHAHTPGQQPVAPATALAGLLAAVGVDARHLPGDLAGRTALWRDRMAGQKALLVLDNAASSAQVIPLLPGNEGCLVLVTSRRNLGDLPGAAEPVQLDALPPHEAREMFTQLASRAAAGPLEAVGELAELAGFLPLAISLLARVFAGHPCWPLADLVAATREARMLNLVAENDSVAAAFGLSYRHLDPGLQELFRRLSLHPGTTIDGYAAAALANCGLNEANGSLDALYREGLLTEVGRRRYGLHDLIRCYARDLAAADPGATREQALERLLDYYQHTAIRAETHLARQTRTIPVRSPRAASLTAAPTMTDSTQALAWARAERASLLACLDYATAAGQHARVVTLTAAMASPLRLDGPWTSALARYSTAVMAAQQIGDRLGQATALTHLGDIRRLTGDHHGALEALTDALDIFRSIGHRHGQAAALIYIGDALLAAADHRGAVEALKEALGIDPGIGNHLGLANALTYLRDARRLTGDHRKAGEALLGIFRDIGNRQGEAASLVCLGVALLAAGDHRGAVGALEEALGIDRGIGNHLGQANALTYLGDAWRLTGDHRGAIEALQEALAIYRDIGHRLGQANALTYLGDARRLTGDHRGAVEALQEALAIYRDIGDLSGQAMALNETGTLHRTSGDPSRAAIHHQQALKLSREITSPWDEAHALAGLGRCALADGHTTDATSWLRQARDIFQRIGAAEAADITAELESGWVAVAL